MLELVYPIEEYAPVIPHITMEERQNMMQQGGASENQEEEMFPVVEPSGVVVAMAARSYCHSGAKPLHPVVHLHIMDRMGRIYLQHRVSTKDIQPDRWDTAVGGHVSYGEYIREALYRESAEELGFEEYNPVYICSYVFESDIERELVSVFVAIGNSFVLKPNPLEISEGRYWTEKEIDECMGDGKTFTPNFEREFTSIRKSLYALL